MRDQFGPEGTRAYLNSIVLAVACMSSHVTVGATMRSISAFGTL